MPQTHPKTQINKTARLVGLTYIRQHVNKLSSQTRTLVDERRARATSTLANDVRSPLGHSFKIQGVAPVTTEPSLTLVGSKLRQYAKTRTFFTKYVHAYGSWAQYFGNGKVASQTFGCFPMQRKIRQQLQLTTVAMMWGQLLPGINPTLMVDPSGGIE
uniref:Transposase n=1 Tax=Ascaris lumbricoides TaxID=6252 RepID=A0A0M3I6B6_ASCLU